MGSLFFELKMVRLRLKDNYGQLSRVNPQPPKIPTLSRPLI